MWVAYTLRNVWTRGRARARFGVMTKHKGRARERMIATARHRGQHIETASGVLCPTCAADSDSLERRVAVTAGPCYNCTERSDHKPGTLIRKDGMPYRECFCHRTR